MLHDEPPARQGRGPAKGATRRGFGRLRKLPSGRWQAQYTGPDGALYKPPSPTFATEDAARGWLAAERKLIDLDTWTPPTVRAKQRQAKGQTFTDYAEAWLAKRTTRDGQPLKPRTLAEYRRYLDRHLTPALGALPVRAVTEARVSDWWEGMSAESANERAHSYQLLRAIMTTATKDKLVSANPCQIDGAGTVRRARRIRIATLDELADLTAAMPDNMQLAVLLGAWCAMRYGEIAELRRRDVDLEAGVVRVSRGVTWPSGQAATVGTPKSEAGVRDVAIPPHLLPVVRAHLDDHTERGRDALLFPAGNGQHLHPRTFGKRFDAAREAAGRPDLHFHDLRHTGAVLAAQSGATIADLMARLGHSTPRMAMHYQHAAAGRDAQIAAALSKLARKPRKAVSR